MKVFGIVLTTVFGFLLLIQAVVVVTMYVVFDRNCEGYLKRAADSNTVEMASRELKKSLDYIESHNLTKGFTSVLYTTPDEDIEFWYTNVKSCYESLIKLKPNATELEKSNMLMKLRETLLDQKKGNSWSNNAIGNTNISI